MNHAEPLTFKDVLCDVWRAKLFILIGIGAALILAYAFIALATPYYKTHMVVSPANPMNGAEVSSLLADDNLFALRYLVQRVGVANSSDFLRFENMYAGASVASVLLKDEKILKNIRQDHVFSFSGHDEKWSAEKLAHYIGKKVRLEPVGATPLRRMLYYHPDPKFGVYFLTRIHQVTDTLIRQNIRQETEERIAYLQTAIDQTRNVEHRRALTTLLMEQERLRMLVSIDQSYAASVIEPAAASFKPRWPDKALLLIIAVFAGALTGFVVHGLRPRT